MSELTPESSDSPRGNATAAPDAPSRSLSEILEELASLTNAHEGEASAMRGAVSELSRALARLFEMIRSDRAEQRERIAELEAELANAQAMLHKLDPNAVPNAAPPPPTDFDQLRLAAERLRERTKQLVDQAGTPAEAAAAGPVELDVESDLPVRDTQESAASTPPPIHDEPFGAPGILRVFPGALMDPPAGIDLDVESDLDLDLEEPRRVAAHGMHITPPETFEPSPGERPASALTGSSSPESDDSGPADEDGEERAATRGFTALHAVPEPIKIQPRGARHRRAGIRRRRIDARKLRGVDPPTALRAMVSSIPHLWTAGCTLDLIIALTDGGTMKVSGGDLEPLTVSSVEPGTAGHSTVTATSAQLVPLFGRLDLTDEQSPPEIHGARRHADLLVGWIDRAQRLAPEPL